MLLRSDNYNKDGVFHLLRDAKGRWYRGAKLWRWTKDHQFAAQLDHNWRGMRSLMPYLNKFDSLYDIAIMRKNGVELVIAMEPI